MRTALTQRYLFAFIISVLLICKVTAQPKKLIHFWDFNQTLPHTGVGDAGGNGDSLGTIPHPLPFSYSTLLGAKIVYTRPHSKQGAATQLDSVLDNDINGSFYYDFSSNNYTYYTASDSAVAAGVCACSGNLSVRVRNPSLNSYLYMYVPTTGYMNVNLSFAVSASSNKGAQYAIFSYSTNGGATWNPLTAAMDTFTIGAGVHHPDTLLVLNSLTSSRIWMPVNINFSSDNAANNSAGFLIRFFSAGPNSVLNTGSDRYDNISILGDSICPVIYKQPLNKTICAGTNTYFFTGVAGGLSNTYQWQVNTGSGFNNVINGGVYNGATTDSLILTNVPLGMNGYKYRLIIYCPSCNNDTSATATLTVNPNPTVTANASFNPICVGSNVTLTGGGASSYTWSGGATNGIPFAPPTTKTYTVTGTAPNGCTNTASITVTVNPLPVVTASTDHDSVCAGNIVTLIGGGAVSYVWTGGATNAIPFSPASTQTYTVTGTDANGCTNTATVQVKVNAIPVVTVSPAAPNICYGNNVTLTANGAISYVWSPPSNLTCTNCQATNASPLTTNTYKVIGVNNKGCTDSTNVTVTVAPQIFPVISGTDTICSGHSTTLTASGGSTYLWSIGATTAAVTLSPLSSTTYSVLVASGVCSDSTTVNVHVNASPVVTISGNNSICVGGNTILTATGGGTYSWSTGATTNAITVSPASTTIYTVSVDNGLCTTDSTYIVIVHPYPVPNITPAQSICPGDSATITASGGTQYAWSVGSTVSSIKVSPTSTTTYTVAVGNGFCITDTTSTVTINSRPIALINGNASICSGDSTILNASGGTSYTWNNGSTTSSVKVFPPFTTTYTVQASNGFCTKDTTFKVTVTQTPDPTISSTQTICQGGSANLLASGGTTYKWLPIAGLNNSTSASVTASPTVTITYTVTEANGTCKAKDSVTVIVNPIPVVAASPNVNILITQSTQLDVTPQLNGDTYIWEPSDGLSCTNCPDPAAAPIVTTTYTVITTNALGCNTVDTVVVNVKDDCGYLFVPNAFSPNGDGHNDVLLVYGVCIVSMNFIVFDRWGNEVFESESQSVGWDGTFKGQKMNPDTYSYYLGVTLVDGSKIKKSGNVALVR